MKKVILFGMAAMLLWSCNNSSEKTTTVQEKPHQETTNHSEHQHDSTSQALELNNGAKWIVNEEMKPYVLKGEELVNSQEKIDNKSLADQLKEQNNQIVKSCTMEGKGHDELHKWLVAHIELVKDLEKETDAAKSKTIISNLQHSYQQYHQYFN